MTVKYEQLYVTPSIEIGDDPRGSIRGVITGTNDDLVVANRAELELPLTVTMLVHGKPVLVYRHAITLEHKGVEVWHVIGKYQRREPKEENHFDVSFDIGGQTTNIKYAKEHIATYNAPAESLPDHNGAINVVNGQPEGLDIEIPNLTFTETHYLGNVVVNDSFLAALYTLVGTVTSTPLRGFEAGELLMTRASGSRRNSEQWELTLAWAYSKNISGETINGVTGVDKDGWHYMWPEFGQEPDSGSKRTKPKLLGYHVERIYEELDHAGTLGIFIG